MQDASEATKVRESYLAALEQEEFSSLGSHVYVRGFLRSYATYLRLDPEPLLEAYSAAHQRPEQQRALPRPEDLERPVGPLAQLPQAPVLVGVALLVLVVLVWVAVR